MHRRSAADAAFGVFVRRQIGNVFLSGFVLPGCTAELNRRAAGD